MSDMKRWLDDPLACESLEARVLSAGKHLELPPGVEERSFSAFVALVGATGAGSATALAGPLASPTHPNAMAIGLADSASVAVGALKALVVGIALGAVGVGTLQAFTPPHVASAPELRSTAPLRRSTVGHVQLSPAPRHEAPERADRAPTDVLAPSPAPRSHQTTTEVVPARRNAGSAASKPTAMPTSETPVTNDVGPSPQSTLGTLATGTAPEPVASADPAASELKAEAQELARARNLLREGLASDAERLLRASARRFSAGALRDERELLLVQASIRLGHAEAARSRARLFLFQYPQSALASRMRRAAGLE